MNWKFFSKCRLRGKQLKGEEKQRNITYKMGGKAKNFACTTPITICTWLYFCKMVHLLHTQKQNSHAKFQFM